ncbi:hypothetical protein BH11ARM2_BH11ARM2_37450 [soil metagenome]
MATFGVVVLAAGGSGRMGRAKQLLPYLGRTLVEHAVRTALASGAAEVVVVVGAEAAAVRERLRGLRIRIVENRDWAEGMGGSISLGVGALGASVERVVVALGDQPRVTPQHLHALGTAGGAVVASSYDGLLGAPCAFARSEFPSLLALEGDQGARALLRRDPDRVQVVVFEDANVDVDTPDDYRFLVPPTSVDEVPEPALDTNEARGPPVAI